jgi:hypothetical protein
MAEMWSSSSSMTSTSLKRWCPASVNDAHRGTQHHVLDCGQCHQQWYMYPQAHMGWRKFITASLFYAWYYTWYTHFKLRIPT